MSYFQEKLEHLINKIFVPETDTGRLVENTKGRERTLSKELGKLAPQLREKGHHLFFSLPGKRDGRSEEAQATVYQKHRSPQSRKTIYGG
jgi:hypothetical protein